MSLSVRCAPACVCVFQLLKDILNVHKRKRKLLLRDATESVYIGGLCNRLLWFLVLPIQGTGVGQWGSWSINRYFDLGL